MAWFSISTIRNYNKDIPIHILFICDDGRENRYIAGLENYNFGIERFCRDSFQKSCSEFGVKFQFVHDLDMKEEVGFHPLQRIAFSLVEDDQILLMDADTFVFGDVAPFFDALKYHDVIVDMNAWGHWGGRIPYKDKKMEAFNSGVVLFNKGILQEYGRQVYDLSLKIKYDNHPVGKWLTEYQKYENTHGKLGREEIAFGLFLYENEINFRLSNYTEIQTNKIMCKTLIHHTQTQNYIKYWKKYFRSGFFKPHMKLKCQLLDKT